MMKSIFVQVTESRISIEEIDGKLDQPSHGAKLVFAGTVRNHNLGKSVCSVSYDAFVPLAEKIFLEICEQADQKWGPDLKISLVHRIGRLEVGETSIVIAVSSPHRDEVYQASRYIIENVKHRAPIWKKEHYEDGETEWLEGHALCGS